MANRQEGIQIRPCGNGRYDVAVDGVVTHRNVSQKAATAVCETLAELIGQAYARGYFKGAEIERLRR